MIVAHIEVSGVHANCVRRMTIPAGLIGGQVKIKYVDPVWDGMSKTAVFRGAATRDVLDIGDLVTIPSEVVAKASHDLWFGIYGVDASGKLAIPLIEAHLGKVAKATDPSGDETTDPSLPVWAQLDVRVKKLEEDGTGGGSIIVDEDGYLTTSGGGFDIDDDGYILL